MIVSFYQNLAVCDQWCYGI